MRKATQIQLLTVNTGSTSPARFTLAMETVLVFLTCSTVLARVASAWRWNFWLYRHAHNSANDLHTACAQSIANIQSQWSLSIHINSTVFLDVSIDSLMCHIQHNAEKKLTLTTMSLQTDHIFTFTVLAGPVWQADAHVLSAS